jgi:hypothetical protein
LAIFVAFGLVGYSVFLSPKLAEINANKEVRVQRETTLSNLRQEFSLERFREVEQQINTNYENGKDASRPFYGVNFTSYEADRRTREILEEVDLEIDNLLIQTLLRYNLNMEIFRPGVVSSEIDEDGVWIVVPAADNSSASTGLLLPDMEPSDLIKRMQEVNRQEAIDFFNDSDTVKNSINVEAMREFLAREEEEVVAQEVSFRIELTTEEANRLSMHIHNLHEWEDEHGDLVYGTTYIRTMTSEPASDGDNEDVRIYNIVMLFFIVRPMDTPHFEYEGMFNWNV